MRNLTKQSLSALLAIPIFAAAADDSKPEQSVISEAPSSDAPVSTTVRSPLVEQLRIGDGTSRSGRTGYYLVFENTANGPKLIQATASRPATLKNFQQQEIIFVSRNLDFAEPDYRDFKASPKGGEFICWTGALRTRQNNNTTDYNPCESTFTDRSINAASYAAVAVFTFGLGAVTGTGSSTMTVNAEKVKAAIGPDAVDAIAKLMVDTECVVDYLKVEACRGVERKFSPFVSPSVTGYISSGRMAQYRSLYSKATTSKELEKFRDTFAQEDMEQLAAKAAQDIPILQQQEWLQHYRRHFNEANSVTKLETFISTYANNDPEKLVPKAKSALVNEQTRQNKIAREQAEAAKQEAALLASWRRNLKIGDDTFCGPVIELRSPMIKIAVNVQLLGYAPEAWLKVDQVFPPAAGCINENGRIRPLRT